MELNRNKLIFWIIWVIVLILFIFVLFSLNSESKRKTTSTWKKDFNIWIVWDDSSKFKTITDAFKKANPKYKDYNIKVSNFWSYDDYTYVLTSAIISNKAPDIFVLNNNEKNSIFSNQVLAIDPKTIDIWDFRKKYKNVFKELIFSGWGKDYLAWLPVWYENLWIFYNSKYVNVDDLTTMSGLNFKINKLKKNHSRSAPLWIWKWTTIKNAADIATQFLMLQDNIKWVGNLTEKNIKNGLWTYLDYWAWTNEYDLRFKELKIASKDATYLFSKWETFMLIWYPRLIKNIKNAWFSKSHLLATTFPEYIKWKLLVNYNYFALNKNSDKLDLWNTFLAYLNTKEGALEYIKAYPYYLPALVSLEDDLWTIRIDSDFDVTLRDFKTNTYELSSFDKWIKNLYDRWLENILDNSFTYVETFEKFVKNLSCKSNKIVSLDNSVDCGE